MTRPSGEPDVLSPRERIAVLVVAFLLGLAAFVAVGPAAGRWWEAVVVGACVLYGGDWLGAEAFRRWRTRRSPRA